MYVVKAKQYSIALEYSDRALFSEKQTNTCDHNLYFMFNLINLSTETTKESNINHISKYDNNKKTKTNTKSFFFVNGLLKTLCDLQKEL